MGGFLMRALKAAAQLQTYYYRGYLGIMGKQKDILEKMAKMVVQIRHVLLRQALAECLGTLILVVSTESFSILPAESWVALFAQVTEGHRLNDIVEMTMFVMLCTN